MSGRKTGMIGRIDAWLVLLYIFLTLFGWLNIYSSSVTEEKGGLFDLGTSHGKQLLWMGICYGMALFIMLLDSRVFTTFAYVFYGGTLALLVLVLLVGQTVDGNKAWFVITSSIKIQPSEFAKFSVALVLGKIMGDATFSFTPNTKNAAVFIRLWFMEIRTTWPAIMAFGAVILPAALILLENDTGSTLVFLSFILAFCRFGFSWIYPIIAVLMIAIFLVGVLVPPGTILLVLLVAGVLAAFIFTDLRNGWKPALVILGFYLLALSLPLIIPRFLPSLVPVMPDDPEQGWRGYPAWMPHWLPPSLSRLISVLLLGLVWVIQMFFRRIIGSGTLIVTIFVFLLGFTVSVKPIYDYVLKPHHRTRVLVLLGKEKDMKGKGWNVNNSKIAIGSGGITGKGFMKGSLTKLKFVPKQRTDFIFSTVGEEWGFWGSSLIILIYLFFMIRLVLAAERQRSPFSRVYGYCVACIMFFHFFMNIGTTIGLAPAVGIPLPFFSYGGSSLLGFTLLLWVFIKLDSQNLQILR